MEWAFFRLHLEDAGTPLFRDQYDRIACVPWLEDPGYLILHGLGQWEEVESAQDHREGITLGDPLSSPDKAAYFFRIAKNEECFMPIAFQYKPQPCGKVVSNITDHGEVVELIKYIVGINRGEKFGIFSILL